MEQARGAAASARRGVLGFPSHRDAAKIRFADLPALFPMLHSRCICSGAAPQRGQAGFE
jgi:hypothetical protein